MQSSVESISGQHSLRLKPRVEGKHVWRVLYATYNMARRIHAAERMLQFQNQKNTRESLPRTGAIRSMHDAKRRKLQTRDDVHNELRCDHTQKITIPQIPIVCSFDQKEKVHAPLNEPQ
ncbi:hypothetical protein KCU93_g214, partial [Aureobasidium melanogenum]